MLQATRLHHDVRHEESHAAARRYADQAGDHEAVVEDIFADARRTGPVEADAGEVGGVRGQEEIAIAGRDEGHDEHRIHADAKRHRDEDGNRGCLRIHQLGGDERDDGIG